MQLFGWLNLHRRIHCARHYLAAGTMTRLEFIKIALQSFGISAALTGAMGGLVWFFFTG